MIIYFVSSNEYKMKEVEEILSSEAITIRQASQKINEIQSQDMNEIVKDKVIKAFTMIRRPVVVEQTGLLIKEFGNLPGGLTQIFWDSLEADRFSQIFSSIGTAEVTAKTVLAFCDGKRVYIFEGTCEGHIVSPPRGNRDFQWDCVFEPDGYKETFAEMGEKKNEISMRKEALEKLRNFLENQKNDR